MAVMVVMFQSILAPKTMMVTVLPALPSPAQALPSPLASGWELIHNVEPQTGDWMERVWVASPLWPISESMTASGY